MSQWHFCNIEERGQNDTAFIYPVAPSHWSRQRGKQNSKSSQANARSNTRFFMFFIKNVHKFSRNDDEQSLTKCYKPYTIRTVSTSTSRICNLVNLTLNTLSKSNEKRMHIQCSN